MDLKSESNLSNRLEIVLEHHNAIRKGLKKKEFKKEGQFISIRHKNDWDVIRKIDAANGINYACK